MKARVWGQGPAQEDSAKAGSNPRTHGRLLPEALTQRQQRKDHERSKERRRSAPPSLWRLSLSRLFGLCCARLRRAAVEELEPPYDPLGQLDRSGTVEFHRGGRAPRDEALHVAPGGVLLQYERVAAQESRPEDLNDVGVL